VNDLVTLTEAVNHLRCEPSDPSVPLLVSAASEAVLQYIGDPAFVDTAGFVPVDTAGDPVGVPAQVKAATLLLLGDLYENRKPTPTDPVPAEYGYGYLSRAVVALLYPFRTPTVA
jgi:hypothetical protein